MFSVLFKYAIMLFYHCLRYLICMHIIICRNVTGECIKIPSLCNVKICIILLEKVVCVVIRVRASESSPLEQCRVPGLRLYS